MLSGKIDRGELRLSGRSSSLESVKMCPKRHSYYTEVVLLSSNIVVTEKDHID